MWPFTKKVGQRRLEVRRSIPPATAALWQRFRQAGGLVAVVTALVMFVVVLAMDVWPLDPVKYRESQYVPEDIRSRVNFSVLDSDKLRDRMKEAAQNAPARFNINADLVARITGDLRKFPQQLKASTQPKDVKEDLRKVLALDGVDGAKTLAAWHSYAEGDKQKELYGWIEALGDSVAGECYSVSGEDYTNVPSGKESAHLAAGPRFTMPLGLSQLLNLGADDAAARIADKAGTLADQFDESLRPGVRAYLKLALASEPMYMYDKGATAELADKAAQSIATSPPNDCYRQYLAGEVIVKRGGGKSGRGLAAADLELLRTEQRHYLAAKGLDRPWRVANRIAMRGVILLAAIVLMCFYIVAYNPRVFQNPVRALTLAGAVILMLAANKLLIYVAEANLYASMLPVLMTVVVLTIAYDQRFALGLGAVLAGLVVLQVRGGVDLFVILAVAIGATVLQLGEIRTRSKLIKVLGIAGLLGAVATWCFGVFNAVPLRFIILDGLWAGFAALLVGFLIQGLLPIIERVFRTVTSMTLLEWCDASKPLMRRIAMEAPGTHNHSLQLGSICEAAADAVGARGLLARVGAYYHDIGKIHKSDYFSENQGGAASKHSKLSPAMSLLVIIGHVKDGIELAKEYGLPRILHEFIATHHGTTLVQYFYHAAAEQRKEAADRAPDEMEFRYPGPKPRSAEAAILMLADASESSVRAMSDPTPGRIENQVHAMVSRRLMDGQLDECDLTLRQVHQIEASIIKSLCGVYHSRISYPAPPGEKPAASETATDDKSETESSESKTNGKNGTDDKSGTENSESETNSKNGTDGKSGTENSESETNSKNGTDGKSGTENSESETNSKNGTDGKSGTKSSESETNSKNGTDDKPGTKNSESETNGKNGTDDKPGTKSSKIETEGADGAGENAR